MSFSITLLDEQFTDYALDTDILLQGPRDRVTAHVKAGQQLADDVTPVMALAMRTYVAEDGSVRFCRTVEMVSLERRPVSTSIHRTRREVAVAGDATLLWRILELMDGQRTVAEIVSNLPVEAQDSAVMLLAALAEALVIDVSGRPFGRFLSEVSKNGVLPNGGLNQEGICELVTDGEYRSYPDAEKIALGSEIPSELMPFYTITRSRRSAWGYAEKPVARKEFDALLTTACGVTGDLKWRDSEVSLRAYPSGGGLYAVEIYPIVFNVDELKPAIYHYRPVENVLELVRPDVSRSLMFDAALPAQRDLLPGAAVMICLTARFRRFERKYGEGSNRVLAAEAGHISQNLILAATALGLRVRPCGGFFDDLIHDAIGIDIEQEQFLLSVIIGAEE